jgi:uncharacterized membrane protein YeiB
MSPEAPLKTHRKETILHIILPMVGGVLLLVAALGVVLLMQQRAQVQIVADIMTMLFLLCPLLVCLFPLYLLLVILAFGMGRLHDGTIPHLERLQHFTASLAQRTRALMNRITAQVINLNAKIEPILDRLSVFEKRQPRGKDQ